MIVHNVAQNTPEWLALRSTCPTASELGSLITDAYKVRGWSTEMPRTYCARKVAEKWLGGPLPSFSGGAAEQGSILEAEVIAAIELDLAIDLERVGFITTDSGNFGCSPDAMGFEIKSPMPVNHVKWLTGEECPPEHMLQVQGAMLITGRDEWRFISYRREFPMLSVVVRRDPEIINTIEDALGKFAEHFGDMWRALVEKNGGERKQPVRHAHVPQEEPPMIGLETFTDGPTEPDFKVKI